MRDPVLFRSMVNPRARFPGGLSDGNREKEGFSRIKMISILPWLRASSFNCKASCWRHFAQWRLLERCCKNATTLARIASFVRSSFHLVFGLQTSQDI